MLITVPPNVLSAAMEVIPEGEVGFCVADDDELIARLRYLAANRDERLAMGARAKRWTSERFDAAGYIAHLRDACHAS